MVRIEPLALLLWVIVIYDFGTHHFRYHILILIEIR
jgi:hypothetical protein